MNISKDAFNRLVNFANGETDPAERAAIIEILDSDPIYLEVLSDIQGMMVQHGTVWEQVVAEDAQIIKEKYEQVMGARASSGFIEPKSRQIKTEDELQAEMLHEMEQTYAALGEQIARMKGFSHEQKGRPTADERQSSERRTASVQRRSYK